MYASSEQRRSERVQVLADQLYRERYHYLLRIAVKNAVNREDAAEAVQFAFLAFLNKFDLDCGGPPLAWLTTTVKRAAWATYRREHLDHRAGQEVDPGSGESGISLAAIPTETADPEESVERAEYVLEARERLAQLKQAEREALGLLAFGYTYHEIGDLNCWSASARAERGWAGRRLEDVDRQPQSRCKMVSYPDENDRFHQGPDRPAG